MPATRSLLAAGLLALAACEGPAPAEVGVGPDGGITPPVSLSWLGTYRGVGRGAAGGEEVTFDPAVLRITPADSVTRRRCPACVTVALDTLFSVVGFALVEPVRFTVGSSADGLLKTLTMERFSGASATANVLLGRLTVEPATGGATVVDVSYVLERR